jgi:hypothetical protein
MALAGVPEASLMNINQPRPTNGIVDDHGDERAG